MGVFPPLLILPASRPAYVMPDSRLAGFRCEAGHVSDSTYILCCERAAALLPCLFQSTYMPPLFRRRCNHTFSFSTKKQPS